ncbi:MAG: ferritin-like domain-containing protein [Solirubrobacterales bacterium]|nr:ferritin-like domain-containing protein [Solirubrobacterales bacterium]
MNEYQAKMATPAGEPPVEFEPMDRSAFLLKGALAAGAVYGASAVGPLVRHAFAKAGTKGSKGDIDILNFALTLEYLEADFYEVAQKEVKLSSDLKKFAAEVGQNEQDHVDALSGAISDLGGKPVAKPTFTFPLKDEKSFTDLSVTFEDTGVSAYNGAGPLLESKDLLATAGSIVQIEGRHAGAIRFMSGLSPTVEAFDTTLDMDAVLKAVTPFIKA